MSNISDYTDPELDELEPVVRRKRKEAKMAVEPAQEVELKPVVVTGPVNIKGQNYDVGDTVMLTEDEHQSLIAVGAPVEGVEAKDDEQIQADHEAGVEAQKARLEADKKAEEEKKEKEKQDKKEKKEEASATAAPKF